MEYKLTKLKNGVRVLTVPMPSLVSATICVWVKTGSRLENRKVVGISHFLEHMVFKGSPKYPSAKIVSETIDSMGASNNAGTSKEWTNFWIKTSIDNLDKAFDILADVVLNPLLKESDIERERQVIFQEMAMYEDTPMIDIGEVFEENIFNGNSLEARIIGTRNSLDKVSKKTFIEYRAKHYKSENIVVSVSGGINDKEVLKLSQKYFGTVKKGNDRESNYDEFVKRERKDKVTLKNKKTDQAHFILGFLTEGRDYKNRFAQGILSTILGSGMSSRLFTEVREKRGYAYSIHSSIDRYVGVGSFDVYAGVQIDKIEEAIKIIINEIFEVSSKKKKISANELKKAKNYIKGKLALSLEDSAAVGSYFATQVMFNKSVLTPSEIYEKIENVKLDQVYEEAKKIFDKTGVYLSIIGPYTDKGKLEKLIM